MELSVSRKTYYLLRDASYLLAIATGLSVGFYNATEINIVAYIAVITGTISAAGFIISELLLPKEFKHDAPSSDDE